MDAVINSQERVEKQMCVARPQIYWIRIRSREGTGPLLYYIDDANSVHANVICQDLDAGAVSPQSP